MADKNNKGSFFSPVKQDYITLGFIFAIVVTIISSSFSIYYTQRLYDGLKTMYEQDFLGANYIQLASIDLINIEKNQKDLLLAQNKEDYTAFSNFIERYKMDMLSNINKADPLFSSKTGQKLIKDSKTGAEMYFAAITRLENKISTGDYKAAVNISLKEAGTNYLVLENLLGRMDNFKQQKNLKFYSTAIVVYQTNLAAMVVILIVSLVIRLIIYINTKKSNQC